MKIAVLLTAWLAGAASLFAQAPTAELALSTSVGYNTQRLSLKLTDEQKKEAERLGQEATRATRAGKFGEALDDYAHGIAVMHAVDWTPDVEYASALRGKLDHALVDGGKATQVAVSLAALYPAGRSAQAKLSATVVLMQMPAYVASVMPTAASPGKEIATLATRVAVDGASGLATKVTIPADAKGDYTLEVRLAEADGSVPEGVRNVFVKALPLHLEPLAADAAKLRESLEKATKGNPAIPTAEYTLALYERADRGEVNPRMYNFRREFAAAQGVVDAVIAGRDPFAGKNGDWHRAYRSNVDQTLQPYRLYVPSNYDRAKATPLIVALHGMGGDENSMFDSYGKELPADAEKAGFLVAAPKGRGQASMYRGTAEQDVLDVLAEVERTYNVDKNRVYLMGHSMGGFGTWSVAMAHPELFAALGPISGGGDTNGMVKIKDIPQYVTHGDDDRTVNVNQSRTMVEAGRKAGAQITYVEVPGGSHVSVAQPAFAPMIEFFRKQAKPAAMTAR